MIVLLSGLALFLGAHVFSAFRDRSSVGFAQRKPLLYKGVYSLISIAGLVLIVMGYGDARQDEFWSTSIWIAPEWTRHLILALMPVSIILITASDMHTQYISKYIKHPMFIGLKIWALAHLIYNGDWPSIALFAGFLAWVVLGSVMAKRRNDLGRQHKETHWKWDVLAVGVGLAITVAMVLFLHEWLIGKPVLVL